ncbi:hypothetical protein GCM10007304_42500 [Rhodococcoides trifolii]|uniref:Ribosomally synthesized peptide with SipW-like signal peptide n=1 Tax=Rhodococcoides trifolii TaxID=908250 RepID=A0A917G6E4_9NOCA|nr:hypothetical protein [Rhodococcus trifolii]GGG24153.1 hypothetical protein GCM10007304_42500 [Rhodococcus trifolii]
MSDRRVRLLAASGLVVGLVVAVATTTGVAASWTDKAFGRASFSAGTFGFQSTVDGGATWATHTAAAPATLTLGTSGTAMLPGTSAYGAVSLRAVTASPAVAVTVDGTTSTATGLGSVMQYTVVRSATCTSASFAPGSTFVVGSASTGVPLSSDSVAAALTLAAGAPSAPGTATPLCFRLTLPDTTAVWTTPGFTAQSLTATWSFIGTA